MYREDRPVREPEDPRRAAMARRSLSRWALRLAVREWKQRILIILLIAVASAATMLGIAVASATPGTPNAGIYGTAQTLAELPAATQDLPAVIAKIEKAYGQASVVYDQPIITGQAGTPTFADPTNILLALATIAITLLFARFLTGMWRQLSVLLGLVAGACLAALLGVMNTTGVGTGENVLVSCETLAISRRMISSPTMSRNGRGRTRYRQRWRGRPGRVS